MSNAVNKWYVYKATIVAAVGGLLRLRLTLRVKVFIKSRARLFLKVDMGTKIVWKIMNYKL